MSLTIRHNAPTLNSTQSCPSCGAPIEPDAKVCTQCGMDFDTGKVIRKASDGTWKRLGLSLLALMILAAGLLTFLKLRGTPQPAPSETQELTVEETPEAATTPPGSMPQTEDPRAIFEAKKKEASEQARTQLNEVQPLYQIGEEVELRRKNGLVDRGTLRGYSGIGTGRVAIVTTPTREVGVPLASLDKPSRRRADPEYRQQFLDHLLSNKPSKDFGE